jgi:hypothetical protein|tara:strand:- start:221 stop:643 length:423 start_codon:yes stop_codon:yes gene_type:complete
MGLFDKVDKTKIESRRYEEKLYEIALDEVESGKVRKGLYAKALAKADGDKDKAGGVYLELRVQSLKDDHKEVQILREGLEVLGEPTLENAKRKVEHTSYLITIFGFLEKTYYVSDGSTKQTKFQTNSLLDLHKWLDENIN